jgi:hypothetical protein
MKRIFQPFDADGEHSDEQRFGAAVQPPSSMPVSPLTGERAFLIL